MLGECRDGVGSAGSCCRRIRIQNNGGGGHGGLESVEFESPSSDVQRSCGLCWPSPVSAPQAVEATDKKYLHVSLVAALVAAAAVLVGGGRVF